MEVVAETDEGQRETFHATDVVFAAGPWTGNLAKKLLGERAGAAGDIVPR
jgi:glycine/D-amino acid oxidase-like deaminating enzyme